MDEKYLWLVLNEARSYALPGYEFYGVKNALKDQDYKALARRLEELAKQVAEGMLYQDSVDAGRACGGCAWTLQKLANQARQLGG